MDGQHRGALPHSAGQTGETIQVHRDVCCDAENRSRPPHSQLLLLGHFCGRKLHRQMGKPHHVLCGQCVCCGYCIAHTHTDKDHHHHQRRPAVCSCEQQGATKCHSPHRCAQLEAFTSAEKEAADFSCSGLQMHVNVIVLLCLSSHVLLQRFQVWLIYRSLTPDSVQQILLLCLFFLIFVT